MPNCDYPTAPFEIISGIYNDILERTLEANNANLNPCKVCGNIPKMAYSCGEFFIIGHDLNCKGCGLRGKFRTMHSNADQEAGDWNAANPKEGKPNE